MKSVIKELSEKQQKLNKERWLVTKQFEALCKKRDKEEHIARRKIRSKYSSSVNKLIRKRKALAQKIFKLGDLIYAENKKIRDATRNAQEAKFMEYLKGFLGIEGAKKFQRYLQKVNK